MVSSYNFLKWKVETEIEQRNKRKQFKMKHSTRDKLVREGNLPKLHENQAPISNTDLLLSLDQNDQNSSALLTSEVSKSHKQLSRTLRKLLKDPSIKEDIIRFTPGHNIPFRLSEDGIWKSDTTIVDKPLESEPSGSSSDVNNVVSYTGSSTSGSLTPVDNQVESCSEESGHDNHHNQDQLSCKDKLYIWWLRNVAIRMDRRKLGSKVAIKNQNKTIKKPAAVPVSASRYRAPMSKKVVTKQWSPRLSHRIILYIIISFFIMMALKTVFMFLSSENELMDHRQSRIFLSAQNGFVVIICFAHFLSFNTEVEDHFRIRHSLLSLPYALMTIGSYLNYGYFMYRQDCINSVNFEANCSLSFGFHKWFDVMTTLGSLLSVFCYYAHLKPSSDSTGIWDIL